MTTRVEKSVKNYIEWSSQRTKRLDFGSRYDDIVHIVYNVYNAYNVYNVYNVHNVNNVHSIIITLTKIQPFCTLRTPSDIMFDALFNYGYHPKRSLLKYMFLQICS